MNVFQIGFTTAQLAAFVLDGTLTPRAIRDITVSGIRFTKPYVSRSPISLEVVADAEYLDLEFANNQDFITQGPEGDAFSLPSGPVLIRQDGLWLQSGGRLNAGAGQYLKGDRYYMEEGVVRLDASSGPVYLGYQFDDGLFGTNRQLSIEEVNGAIRFVYRYTHPINGLTTYVFDDPSIPEITATPLAPGALGEYLYYRFLRTADFDDQFVSLFVVTGSGSMIVPFTAEFLDGAPSTQNGFFQPTLGSNILNTDVLNWRILWWRSVQSDASAVVTGGGPWTTPRVYDVVTANSSGDNSETWLDAGEDDVYWGFVYANQIANVQGSTTEIRAFATNNVPGGNISALFTGPFLPLLPGQITEIGNPQGRYLVLQIRFTPSPSVSLSGQAPSLFADPSGEALSAAYSDTPFNVTPEDITLTLSAERSPVGTVPVTPHYVTDSSYRAAAVRTEFEFPYVTSFALQTKTRAAYQLVWTAITEAEMTQLRDFFEQQRGGEIPFEFPLPEGGTGKGVLASDEVRFEELAPTIFSGAVDVEETFA